MIFDSILKGVAGKVVGKEKVDEAVRVGSNVYGALQSLPRLDEQQPQSQPMARVQPPPQPQPQPQPTSWGGTRQEQSQPSYMSRPDMSSPVAEGKVTVP